MSASRTRTGRNAVPSRTADRSGSGPLSLGVSSLVRLPRERAERTGRDSAEGPLLRGGVPNGHVIDDHLERPNPPASPGIGLIEGSASYGSTPPPPPSVPSFCGHCGARVVQACWSCDVVILGAHMLGLGSRPLERPESWHCGEPYPWATREERVGKVFHLIDHEDLDEATLLTVRERIAVL